MEHGRRTLSIPSISLDDVDAGEPVKTEMMPGFLDERRGSPAPPAPVPPPPSAGGHAAVTDAAWPPPSLMQHSPSPSLATAGHGLATLGKPQSASSRSRSASTSSLSTPTGPVPAPKKKIVTACQRCRTRKIRCDGALPACKSCVKAGVECIEVDRNGDNNMPRSHVLELENRIKWLEDIVSTQCPGVDLSIGPPVELRSRASPPAIRIVTTGPDFEQAQSMSSSSSPVFALSPASTCATPVSFDFSSPGVSPGYLQPMSPFTFSEAGPSPSPSPAPSSPFLQPHDPLAHEVGLLSLSASNEPKYVGPSSGVSFARMVFADAKENDVLHQSDVDTGGVEIPPWVPHAPPAPCPTTDECITFSRTYFETVHLQYPFLHKPCFDACLEAVYHQSKGAVVNLPPGYSMAVARFHVFLVLSIGADILSIRLGNAFDSEGYYSAALELVNKVSLTGSVQGAQSALLLAMRSLQAPGGWNIWHLNATIIATCVDLGLHRRLSVLPGDESSVALKRRVFWSAYAFDRSLATALGRPYGIPDDACDIEFPDDGDNDEELTTPTSISHSSMSPSGGGARVTFSGSIYLLRIIKTISNIRSRLYRTSRSARNYHGVPPDWQMMVQRELTEQRDQARTTLGSIRRVSGSGGGHSMQILDLKFHEAIQLLFRPSPAFPQPSSAALQQCYMSAVETIRIYSKLKRFRELPSTYLTVLSVFLSGVTILYAYKNCREVQSSTTQETLKEDVQLCSLLLGDLSQRWPNASRTRARFDEFAQATLTYLANTASRMLSPHDGARRASVSSHRSLDLQQPHTLDVPPVGGTAPYPRLGQPWHPTPSQGILPGHNFDITWMSSMGWDDVPLPPGEELGMGGMEGLEHVPVEGVESMLSNLMGEDTPMWGMDPMQPPQE